MGYYQDQDLAPSRGETTSVFCVRAEQHLVAEGWALVAKVLWIAVNWMLTSMR